MQVLLWNKYRLYIGAYYIPTYTCVKSYEHPSGTNFDSWVGGGACSWWINFTIMFFLCGSARMDWTCTLHTSMLSQRKCSFIVAAKTIFTATVELSVLCFAAKICWHLIPVTSLFTSHLCHLCSFHVISSDLISPNLIQSHLTHLMSFFSTFFTSSHLIASYLISRLLSSSQLVLALRSL